MMIPEAVVKQLHKLKRMDTEALSRSVFDAFELVDEKKIERIYKRWEYVLELIIKGEGTNDLVEMNCGLTKSLCDLPNVKRTHH
jgi:rRNA-processing protein FCF1